MDAKTADHAPPLFRLEGVDRSFQMGEVQVRALADVNLEIATGELLVILGPSGSGKSTLLNLIGGMDRPTHGHVWHRHTHRASINDDALTEYRRKTHWAENPFSAQRLSSRVPRSVVLITAAGSVAASG
ncbi:MAG: ATP-binding cassette domain-containing protein [Planctomycetota bacterium]